MTRIKTITSRRMRRAEISKGLLIALAAMGLIAAGVWGYKLFSKEKVVVNANAPEREYLFVCGECKARTMVKYSQFKTMKQDENGGMYQCPKCGKLKAVFYRPGGSVLPGGG